VRPPGRAQRLKRPDSIRAATALHHNAPVFIANDRRFSAVSRLAEIALHAATARWGKRHDLLPTFLDGPRPDPGMAAIAP
jgi:predicted nucleic acid-binding protein